MVLFLFSVFNLYAQKQEIISVIKGEGYYGGTKYTSGRVSKLYGKVNNEIYAGKKSIISETYYGWATIPINMIGFKGDIIINKLGIVLGAYSSIGDGKENGNAQIEMGVFSKR